MTYNGRSCYSIGGRAFVATVSAGILLGGCSSSTPSAQHPPGHSPTASDLQATVGTRPPDPSATSVWERLASRPLHTPTVRPSANCPVTRQWTARSAAKIPQHLLTPLVLGPGPAYPGIFTDFALLRTRGVVQMVPHGHGWLWNKVLWAVSLRYKGPVLVRGRQIDGPNTMRFDRPNQSQLRIAYDSQPSNTLVPSVGCYAWQMDGIGFSRVIVFRVVRITRP